jgi:phosphate:Na+ symporter
VIAVGLVNAGVLSFRNTLGILFGANVGTTVTAQLVALKLTDFAPALILAGFAIGLIPFRGRIFGRSIFYFGLVFFSLNMVSGAVAPLRSDPTLISILSQVDGPITGVLAGAAFTAIVQSSSVTTGLAIILLQQGVLPFEGALPIILGANVGTTVTAIIASLSFDTSARRTAVSHTLYNIGGVLLFLPFLKPFQAMLEWFGQSPAVTLATAHLIFNAVCAALFLALIRPFAALVERLVPEDDTTDPIDPPPKEVSADLDKALADSVVWVSQIVDVLQPAYTAAVLALQTRDRKIENRAARLTAIVQYGLEEGRALINRLAHRPLSEDQSTLVLRLVVTFDHVRQMTDSLEDLQRIGHGMSRRASRFSVDALLDIQRVFPLMAKVLQHLAKSFEGDADATKQLRKLDDDLRNTLSDCYRRFVELARTESEGTELADFLSIHQRLRSKVSAFAEHLEDRR